MYINMRISRDNEIYIIFWEQNENIYRKNLIMERKNESIQTKHSGVGTK